MTVRLIGTKAISRTSKEDNDHSSAPKRTTRQGLANNCQRKKKKTARSSKLNVGRRRIIGTRGGLKSVKFEMEVQGSGVLQISVPNTYLLACLSKNKGRRGKSGVNERNKREQGKKKH